MAGKTLTGIGEDESGRHELAADKSDSAIREAKPPSTRPTDRMPMSTIIGVVPPSGVLPGAGSVPAAPVLVAPPSHVHVDDDKVAEGLKRLRSLDEPLGPIPSSMPTLKEGMPAVGSDTPTPPHPATIAAAAAAESIRSRGTANGHALSAAAGGQGIMPLSIDDRLKGTLLGHSLHLPDLPEVVEENRPAEVREVQAVSRVAPAGALTPGEMNTDFSHGDARFFDSEPVNTEFEPEKHVRQHRLMVRGLIIGGVAAIVLVGAIAWIRAHQSESPRLRPSRRARPRARRRPRPPRPTTARRRPPRRRPTSPRPPRRPRPRPAPAPTAAAPEEVAPPPAVAPTPVPAVAHSRHESATAEPHPASHPSTTTITTTTTHAATTAHATPTHGIPTHAPRSAESARAPTKPAVSGKRVKVEEDPDGTLPLDE